MNRLTYARAMGASCVCILAIILIAGLWPFHAPKNDVAWLAEENGLRFGHHGSILSSSAFGAHVSSDNSSGSLEIGIEPARSKGRNSILVFEGSGRSDAPFLLQQRGNALIVQRANTDEEGTRRTAELVIERALPEKKRRLVTITLGPSKTSVYLDGVLTGKSQISEGTTGTFAGRLVLGNSLKSSDSWPGQIWGLAIYDNELSTTKVFEHYQDWTKNQRPIPTQDEQPAAVYLFGEGEGNVVHNQLGRAPDLIIPVRYFVLQPEFLSFPWRHYHATWSYWEDVGINVAGFIPFGFFFVAYFSTLRAARYVPATVIFLGFLASLTIEVLQAYLPTRDSGMNDLITNTFGTVLGVLLYRSSLAQKLMRQFFSKQLPT